MKLKTVAKVVAPIAIAGLLVGCNATVPKGAMQLKPESLELRQIQTKNYESVDESKVMSTAVAVMQDLGYTIKESESGLGLVVGEKRRDAMEAGQVALAVVGALFGVNSAIDKNQLIKMSLVVSPKTVNSKESYDARIAIQRIVWNTQGHISRIETIEDKEIYAEFFSKLDKAMFLEKNT